MDRRDVDSAISKVALLAAASGVQQEELARELGRDVVDSGFADFLADVAERAGGVLLLHVKSRGREVGWYPGRGVVASVQFKGKVKRC
jgi:hypothetical protein